MLGLSSGWFASAVFFTRTASTSGRRIDIGCTTGAIPSGFPWCSDPLRKSRLRAEVVESKDIRLIDEAR